ncbi:cytochrome P450 [Nocardia vinacea]|uniref:Cytochrome P450 n=1 Tax=Nocardia vinacea TaxID=96468 RepID=A0ABZ1YSF7_9NOCA|nr:cytochrome P450 [Nocardia vinacea]
MSDSSNGCPVQHMVGEDEHGQFDHHDPAFIANPWATYETLRSECPVLHSDRYDGYWLVTQYDDILAIIKDWETFTSSVVGTLLIPTGVSRTLPYLPLESDPPEHTRYRSYVRPVFSPRRVNAFAGQLAQLARELLAPMFERGEGNIPSEFSEHMSATTLATFVGLPPEDHELWVDLVHRAFEGNVRDEKAAQRASAEFRDYVTGLIARRREQRADDLISQLMDADADGRGLTDDEIFGFVLLLLVAGHETTASALSYAFWLFASRPDTIEFLREDRRRIPLAIEEIIRLSSPVSIFARNATKDVELRGQKIKKGDVVGMAFASANRDERHFDHAEEVRLDRTGNDHLGFGHGTHVCLGAPLARLELTSAINALLDADVDISLGGDIGWSGRGDVMSMKVVPVTFRPRVTS